MRHAQYVRALVTKSSCFGLSVLAVLLTCWQSSYADCAPPSNGLVSWWPGEGDANDIIGTNVGTLSAGISFVPGEVGQAFSFDGVTGYIEIPASESLDVGQSTGFTIETWVNPPDYVYHPIAEWNPNGGVYGVHFWISQVVPGDLYANIYDTANNSHVIQSAGGIIVTNSFQHIAVTYDKSSGVACLYLNGELVQEANLGTFTPQTSYDLYLGYRPPNAPFGEFTFNGLLDEVSLYSRALSAAEVQNIYAAGAAGKCTGPSAPQILEQPANQTVPLRGSATFTVGVIGSQPITYQWRFNGAPLADATNASLVITNVQTTNAGEYSVSVTNSIGFAASSNATLQVQVVRVYGNGVLLTNSQYSFGAPVTIRLTNLFVNGSTFYTLDGSEPTFASTQYTGPFTVSTSAIIRALGYSSDFLQSGQSAPITVAVLPSYTLTVAMGGGGASVVINPPTGPYLSNTVVSLTATPASGWTFLQWLGDAVGTNTTTTVTITRNKTVQAVFGTTLSTTAAGGGAVVLNPPGGVYPYGAVVWLTGVPQAGNYFGLWGNAASGNANPLSFTVTNPNPVVSSLFGPVASGQAGLTIVPLGKGQVTVSPRANVYTVGQNISLTANPALGQAFLGWSGDATGTQNPLALVMNTNKLIYATFSDKPALSLQAAYDGLKTDGFQLTLLGDFGAHYRIATTTDFSSWTPLGEVTNWYGTVQFNDPGATVLEQRFYRAVQVP